MLRRTIGTSELSQISFAGTLRVADGLTFDVAFLSSLFGSVVSVDPVSITGGSGVKGASYQCKDSVIIKSVILPGGDTPYFENEGCLMSGKNAEQHPIARLRAELIEKSERQFAAVEAKLTQQDAIELKRQDAIEAKLTQQDALAAWLAEEESRRSHQQQRHNRIDDILIGVVALLLLGNAVLLWRYWGPRIARRQP